MSADVSSFSRQSFKWIKADSGHTYLCPVDALSRIDNPTEEHDVHVEVNRMRGQPYFSFSTATAAAKSTWTAWRSRHRASKRALSSAPPPSQRT